MSRFIAWLKKVWIGPIDPLFGNVLDRCDDREFVVELWRSELATEELDSAGKSL